MNPFVITPVDKEAVRSCEVNLTITQLEARTRYLVCSVFCPCLFYKLTLEGAIVTYLMQCARSEETGKYQTWWQDGDHLEEDQNRAFLPVRIKQTKYL